MINVICPGSSTQAGEIVALAFVRSCSSHLVTRSSIAQMQKSDPANTSCCWVLIDPLNDWADSVIATLSGSNSKVIIFGTLPPKLAQYLNVSISPVTDALVEAAKCAPAISGRFSQSAATVRYISALGSKASPLPERFFCRYDFTDEWNNLGYGSIHVDTACLSIWALAQCVVAPASNVIAEVRANMVALSAYAGVWDTIQSSLLWFNRAVGPVDSQEWALVEHFIASYRSAELSCWPVLREIPYGFEAAVTMRLDCDEDVESARPLWAAYRALDVPFSLALHTKVLSDPLQHVLPREVLADGGALLSHTATHAPDWGGSYDAAFVEGTVSSARIADISAYRVKYAVSPFHQTPGYARAALADAGYAGCIGGIIRNDPDFLTARSGQVPAVGEGFIGHSQQCMLHGDCVLKDGDPHVVFKQAFDFSKAGGAFFGYLDHPFSPRYQYGWQTEAQRIEFHQVFIAYMKQTKNVLFCNESDAMDFLHYRASIRLSVAGAQYAIAPSAKATPWAVAVEYRGNLLEVTEDGVLL
jgi:hypothetical protein